MNFSRKLAAGISLIFFFIGATAQAHETQKYGGLKMPESVLVDKHGRSNQCAGKRRKILSIC